MNDGCLRANWLHRGSWLFSSELTRSPLRIGFWYVVSVWQMTKALFVLPYSFFDPVLVYDSYWTWAIIIGNRTGATCRTNTSYLSDPQGRFWWSSYCSYIVVCFLFTFIIWPCDFYLSTRFCSILIYDFFFSSCFGIFSLRWRHKDLYLTVISSDVPLLFLKSVMTVLVELGEEL